MSVAFSALKRIYLSLYRNMTVIFIKFEFKLKNNNLL